MAYFLFIDESGSDLRESPYEVLAGLAIEDRDLWNFIKAIQDAELRILGTKYRDGVNREIKGRKFLKKKVFKQAKRLAPFPDYERTNFSKACIEDGESSKENHIVALSQAKLKYVEEVIEICNNFRCKVFATISKSQPREDDDDQANLLRRNYVYLFERFFYFLEDKNELQNGIIIFDELERDKSHILLSHMDNYFKKTANGKIRASLIIPEPFFVHSDLTTGIQIADIIAYIMSWAWMFSNRTEPCRTELLPYARLIAPLKYITDRPNAQGEIKKVWSIVEVK